MQRGKNVLYMVSTNTPLTTHNAAHVPLYFMALRHCEPETLHLLIQTS